MLLHCALVFLFFTAGVVTALSFSGDEKESVDRWESLEPLNDKRVEGGLERMIASGRWKIEAVNVEVEESGPSGEFSEDYLLVGIVSGDVPYALLRLRHTNQAGTLLSVKLGDLLESDWLIAEITDVAVVAERNSDSQRVELFKSE